MPKIIKYFLLAAFFMLLYACDSDSKFKDIEEAINRNKYDVTEIIVRPTKTITVGNEAGSGTTYLPLDYTEQFKAAGITSAGEEIDISADITWSSSNSNVAQVNQSGVVTTFGNSGPVSIVAQLASIQGQAAVQVSAEPLTALEIAVEGQVVTTPYDVDVCTPVQFSALGTYGASEPKRYVTHLVGWVVTHTDPADPTMTLDPISRVFNQDNKKGLYGAWSTTASVKAELSVSLDTIESSPLELNVQGSVSEINISPNGATIPLSGTQQFTASGKYSSADASTSDFTDAALWSTADSTFVNVSDSNPGLVTGVGVGSPSLEVSCGGENDFVTVTVTDAVKLERISIDYMDDFIEMTQNETIPLKAFAYYSDGSSNEITKDDNTNWSVRIIDTDRAKPINVSNDANATPVNKGEVTYIGGAIVSGEKRFAEVVVKYDNNLEDDIAVVVIP